MSGPKLQTWFYAGRRGFMEFQTNWWGAYFCIWHQWFGGVVLKWQWHSGDEWRCKDGWVVWMFDEQPDICDTGYQILAPGQPYYGEPIDMIEECIWTMEN